MTRVGVGLAVALACSQSAEGMRHRVRRNRDNQTFHLRILRDDKDCEILDAEWGQVHRLAKKEVYTAHPMWEWFDEEEHHSKEQVQDFWGPNEGSVRESAKMTCEGVLTEQRPSLQNLDSNAEVRCIECSGESNNRIDVVLMGDGYQEMERDRFFEDMERLKREMFADQTFRSYLPVFNIWAIHVPSKDTGIGYNGRAKNTPFGLYKNGQQHRGVMYTSGGRSNARSYCRLAGGCDFPSLIGNDEFYGGLGGEFTIGTRSKTTGTVVLRHEMGHNFVYVGEEYDNGQAYRGVNNDRGSWMSNGPPQDIKWKHWLTEPDKQVREEKQRLALATYPWKDMANGRQTFTFNTDGQYSSWRMSFTVSGYPEEGSLKVTLDGKVLDWSPTRPPGAERPDGSTVDRQFYHFGGNASGFSSGSHTLTFESMFPPGAGEPIRQLCSISIYEYGSDSEFNASPGYVGAYPTWNTWGSKSYRPMNEQCLMRDMESIFLCPICREGMWLQFLSRMELLDDIKVTSGEDTTVELIAVPLAQLRPEPIAGITESYSVVWKKGGIEQSQFRDQFSFSGPKAELSGSWEVTLHYSTSEVRKDDRDLLTAKKTFTI